MPGRAGRHPRPIAPAYRQDLIREQSSASVSSTKPNVPTSNLVGLGSRCAMEQKRTADTQVASKGVVLVTLAVVVAAFLGSSGYAEYRTRRTHELTAEIANNESPSISYL